MAAAAGAGSAAAAGSAGPLRRTVLVVDDEEIVRNVAKVALERRGYLVELAEGGEIAVEMFRRDPHRFAGVLLDMTMPVLSGEETMQQIHAIRPGVPVIASSGYTEAEAMRRFGSAVAGYIQKPYTAGRLAEKIAALIGPP